MNRHVNIREKFLYEIWKTQNFHKGLRTGDAKQIEIISPGEENKETDGPDFLHAKIRIDNITYIGDVEIDIFNSDWESHKHRTNKWYNKVILHVVLNSNMKHTYVISQDGRRIPSVCISSFLSDDLRENIQKSILSERNNRMKKMPCIEMNNVVDEKDKLNFIYDLGVLRFRFKCDKLLSRLKEISYLQELSIKEPVIGYDFDERFFNRTFTLSDFNDKAIWHQLIYESVFESLGYSKNKEIMKSITKAADVNYFNQYVNQNNFTEYIEAALFNISGLLPEIDNLPDAETSTYFRNIHQIWKDIRPGYDGKFFHLSEWHFLKMRPQNFPTIRLAGGVHILNRILRENLFGKIIEKFENQDIKDLPKELQVLITVHGQGYWSHHYVYNQPSKEKINYFVGISRSDEIIINIILPILVVYFNIFNRKELTQKVISLYLNYYQKSDNSLVNEVSSTLSLNTAWKRSVLYQGFIELFRNYCLKDKCSECQIGKKVFN
ncbi:MAG TPA: DUF2851 family protein [Ignavibacteriaceae bacterium]|nr:DUF2851 family protein [Ignavibacteriaceae bacterium]